MINLFRFVKFSALVCLGLALIIPAIIIGPFCKKLPINTNRPWVDGLIINLLRAYKNTIQFPGLGDVLPFLNTLLWY